MRNVHRHSGFKKMTGGGDQRPDSLFGHRSSPRKGCSRVYSDCAVNGSRRALGDLEAGVARRVSGPLRGSKAENAAQHQQRNRHFENRSRDALRSDVPETRGGPLQRLVACFERVELHESLAAGHQHELGMESSEHRVHVSIRISPNLREADLKRERHSDLPGRVAPRRTAAPATQRPEARLQ